MCEHALLSYAPFRSYIWFRKRLNFLTINASILCETTINVVSSFTRSSDFRRLSANSTQHVNNKNIEMWNIVFSECWIWNVEIQFKEFQMLSYKMVLVYFI